MKPAILTLTLVLTVGNLAHCQDCENLLFIKMEVVLEKQEAALSQLKEMQEKQGHIDGKLQEMQEKQGHIEGKLEHIENNLQGIHQETRDCLRREDLEGFKNISAAGQQELESSLHQEISGVISLLEAGGIDECSEGSHNCGDYEACTDKFVSFTCRCLPGFARNGSHCEDIDECTQGKAECSPQATCRNSIGSYSCSCNPPFEGDGQTCDIDECTQGKAECSPQATCRNSIGSYSCSCNPPFEGDGRTCESPCKSPAKFIEGLGCVKLVKEYKSWQEMKATCQKAGGRLLQQFNLQSLQDVVRTFGYYAPWVGWVGVYEGKWLESGIPLEEELWLEGYPTDPSERCGFIVLHSSSSLYKVTQYHCSMKLYGYCQIAA